MNTVSTEPRRIPGVVETCNGCGADIVFALTLATESGRGGRYMPLDPFEDLAGNTAVRPVTPTHLVCRVLKKDESHDRTMELLAMPLFATCTNRPEEPQLPASASEPARRPRRRTTRRRHPRRGGR